MRRDRTRQLLDRFEVWLSDKGLSELAEPAQFLLTGRRNYSTSREPTYWRSGDVHALLLVIAPERLTDPGTLAEHGAEALEAFLRFLDETGRLHPASTKIPALLKELARAADKMAPAMADRSRWGMAKTLYTAMLADGVALGDESGAQNWFAAFNETDEQHRHTVLAALLTRQPELRDAYFVVRDGIVAALRRDQRDTLAPAQLPTQLQVPQPQTYRAVRLRPETELAVHAARSLTLHRMAALAEWARPGRAVTKKGELLDRDLTTAAEFITEHCVTPSSELVLGTEVLPVAYAMECVEIRYGKLTAGERLGELTAVLSGGASPADILSYWLEAFDCAMRPDRTPVRDRHLAKLDPIIEELEPISAWTLEALYIAARPLAWDDLISETLADSQFEGADDDKLLGLLISTSVRARLHAAMRHGAVSATWDTSMPAALDEQTRATAQRLVEQGTEPWQMLELPGLTIELTPLGTWGMRENLHAEGNIAPVKK
ncbi:hypothetical protein [Actinospica robiniae]|uniref:hypothetical protein n=1 Tax=Actinospica robiniae TaxID=304901 RepID=UPI0003FFB4DC|nr:hypothetical protein [Actinospica robiniae]